MRRLSLPILLIFILPASAFSYSFYDVINQTVAGPLLREKTSEYVFTPAVGFNTRMNGLQINDQGSLSTTNRNSYLIGLDINGSYTTLNLPFKDPSESRKDRVDSELLFISTSLNITEHLKGELAYEYNKGYFSEENPEKGINGVSLPDLSLQRVSTSLYYLKNKDHSSFLFSPVMYKKSKDSVSSSWIYGVDLSRYEINNISPGNLNQRKSTAFRLTDVEAYDLSFGAAYSKNWFFQHWFVGGAFGLNYDLIYLQKKYLDSKQISDTQGTSTALMNFSFGYTWTSLTMGSYVTIKGWNISVDEARISNNQGKTGMYVTYAF